jgi:predicted adenine nucleotide alpha hydrolase (AANH) superfamily ATPase
MKKLLVQACCGACACFDGFEGFAVTLFFNGDNFDTPAEFARRLAAFETVCREMYGGRGIVEPYFARVFPDCPECIRYRLARCADAALKNGFDAFSTTMTVSPHKDAAQINEIGNAIARETGVEFVALDLKKRGGFHKSVTVSRELGIYRQNYCGCARSVR